MTASVYEKYLFFSYIPRQAEADLSWLNCDFEYDFGKGIDDEQWWVDEGVKALKRTMAEQIASTDEHALHVVPLSGGMDSRVILGGLLENLPHSQIVAATYGIPGAWDFEIAKLLAHTLGIRHEIFDLSNDPWEVDDLNKAAVRLTLPVSVHQSYVRQKITNHFGKDCIYWSGFMGGTLTGSLLQRTPSPSKSKAIKEFISVEATPNYQDERFRSELAIGIEDDFPWDRLNQRKLSFDRLLNFCLRQRFLTQPIVTVNGFRFMMPFIEKTWVNFMANVPYKWLLYQHLYRRIIGKSYKELARLPSRAMAGMPLDTSLQKFYISRAFAKVTSFLVRQDLPCSNPRTNYINFTESLRHGGRFQDSVYATLQELKKRQLFDSNEIDQWWCDHQNAKMDYTKLLMNLSSLELLLQVRLI